MLYTKEDLDKIDSNSLVSVYAMHTPISHPMYHPTPYLPYLADFDALSLIPGASMHPVSPVYPPYQSSDTGFDYLPPGRSSHGDMFRKSILELDLPHNQPCQTSAMKRFVSSPFSSFLLIPKLTILYTTVLGKTGHTSRISIFSPRYGAPPRDWTGHALQEDPRGKSYFFHDGIASLRSG